MGGVSVAAGAACGEAAGFLLLTVSGEGCSGGASTSWKEAITSSFPALHCKEFLERIHHSDYGRFSDALDTDGSNTCEHGVHRGLRD